jgi:predicted transcriptional regulator
LPKYHSSTKLKNKIDYFSRRGSLDIMSSILKTAKHGKSKTQIMYKCNLSYDQLKNYIQLLFEIGLFDKHSSTDKTFVTFKATAKGLKFLRTYAELKAIMNLDVNRD